MENNEFKLATSYLKKRVRSEVRNKPGKTNELFSVFCCLQSRIRWEWNRSECGMKSFISATTIQGDTLQDDRRYKTTIHFHCDKRKDSQGILVKLTKPTERMRIYRPGVVNWIRH